MVVTGLGLRGQNAELPRAGVPELGVQDGVLVAVGDGIGLTAHGDHLAVGQDHAVGEGPGVGHGSDPGGPGPLGAALLGGGLGDGDHVGGVGGRGVLIAGRAAQGEDLPRVVVDGVAVHGVPAGAPVTGRGDGARAGGGDPVHLLGRPGLEHLASGGGDEPAVVVGAVGALGVVGVDGRGRHLGQLPPARRRGPDLGQLVPGGPRPRAPQGEGLFVGQQRHPVVAATDVHARARAPRVGRRVVDAGLLVAQASGHHDVAVGQDGHAGTEHVVVGVGDQRLADRPGGQVEDGRLGVVVASAARGEVLVGRPHQELVVGQQGRRHRDQGEADDRPPLPHHGRVGALP